MNNPALGTAAMLAKEPVNRGSARLRQRVTFPMG